MEKTKDKIATIILYVISGFVILLLVAFISYILIKGGSSLNPSFIFGNPKFTEAGGGIGPQLFNSFYLLIITLIITIPIGVGAGIYLAEYAREGKILNIIRLSIETMAALPSIVVGLFGLVVFVQMAKWGYSLIAGALAITILNLSSMTRVCENAISVASLGVKESSLGLGATKWQTIKKVILPMAMPQILTGIILASGRIFGEAAALIYTAGMSASPLNFSNISFIDKASPFAITRSTETLAVYIWKINSEGMLPDATKVANGASAVLVIMILLFNFTARILGKKLHESYTGKI
ncbi:phosphate ABC transporter permease PstA [Clostridium algidicarnis]|uniref:phosphate ABC transporter permease PstA n=1 Tax=Clostridium algidicarnis TaxID=37659 RepID=UPI001C0D5BE7|nr:phosphate ABC transporter permease PstA [Clostridium algidicarnis]MBU3195609.1 phosphate ABC transporter permease PstA [Clostridium algidicarnis]MBU3208657.1 phosphate ABC transporter permease PstA [Clostridium algidicarnis]MBU3226836.1 phosphate ABC transporter permease PstA [Clostridium algidicarnis]MBU3250253.1 phosphate ABC transporter permease PstA [Clostridium algidicarnis]